MRARTLLLPALVSIACLSFIPAEADPLDLLAQKRRFESADGKKSFVGILTGYNPETKIVSVKIDRRTQKFKIDVLSEADQKFVIENGERLAMADSIDVELDDYTDKYTKKTEKRIKDRIYPSGYEIKISNRAKRDYDNVTLEYTVYYGVQGYLEPERETKEASGTIDVKTLTQLGRVTFRTDPVSIVSGELEPVIENESVRNPDGTSFIQPVVKEPGGRRKDQLIGCSVRILIDGKLVKTVTEGNISLEQRKLDP
ncbi:hypothetical protein HAHE_31910 [Haloferula helveola]|uniref:Uncharacterized protein n=1 Tax=Haloferula helveola TaxID=490095 RepID=A0ABM7RPN7_9BACT|nr:hypothetical protein HAHE_31910 [Haloferula helveola]